MPILPSMKVSGRVSALLEKMISSLFPSSDSMSFIIACRGPMMALIGRFSKQRKKNCAILPVTPLSDEGGRIFGELKAAYQSQYRLPRTALARDTVDLMIAASALETGSVLVSHDQVFRKIQPARPDLKLEDWAA